MRIDKFKELLIKKTANSNLHTLIAHADNEFLLDMMLESLEKMARSSQHRKSNAAVQHFGSTMDPDLHPKLIHDALSHHASQYKSAVNSDNKSVANQHMRQIFKYMHLSHKLVHDGGINHTGNKLSVEAIDPKPWERSHYSEENNRKSSTNTKGWARDMADYSWLRGAPHKSYSKETDVHGHGDAYPLEQIRINGKYIHIDDNVKANKFQNHSFDHHPIMSAYSKAGHYYDDKGHNEYLSNVDKYNDGEHMDAYFDKHEGLEQKDPEAYGKRGSVAANAVHKPASKIDVNQLPEHLRHLAPKKEGANE